MHPRRHFQRKLKGGKEETLDQWIEAHLNWKAQMMKLIIMLTNVRKDIHIENGPVPSQVFLILLILVFSENYTIFPCDIIS